MLKGGREEQTRLERIIDEVDQELTDEQTKTAELERQIQTIQEDREKEKKDLETEKAKCAAMERRLADSDSGSSQVEQLKQKIAELEEEVSTQQVICLFFYQNLYRSHYLWSPRASVY